MFAMDRHKAVRRPVSSVGPSTSSSLFNRRDHNGILSLHGKDFVLDIENGRMLQRLTTEIEKLGGRIVEEVSEDTKPYCVVSDSPAMEKLQKFKPDQVTPQIMKGLPMLVRDAIRLRVRYRSCKAFLESLEKLKKNIKNQRNVMQAPTKKATPLPGSSAGQGSIQLQQPYLKLEDNRGAFAPVYKQFTPQSNCQKIYLGKDMGKSLFHKNNHPNKVEKSPCDKGKGTAMPKGGYCELCGKKFDNGKEHFASREHTHNVSLPGMWDNVDKLCGSFLDYVSSANPRSRRHRPSPPSPSEYHRRSS
ncbi:hypothetical protein PMAYCL1PPCAC_11770 [Pristionchus mayeri]|uniref:DBF4-type domain-containing protein n=1 Tax=Pristionchus mayeri TaxID=1317129 RepID=A0AAN4ZPV0_9BILA|nr:hypothetical protein PMAYCL1PPCAC_11770 [Pristionchus mayeri]